VKRSEFEQRQLQERIRMAAQRPYDLTTLLERGERVFAAERFEQSYPDAAVRGLLRETPAGREQEQREQEQRRAADRAWQREWRRAKARETPRPVKLSPAQVEAARDVSRASWNKAQQKLAPEDAARPAPARTPQRSRGRSR
jgi:hypothetical protein